jgi:uroporphyrin-3 C-methyltransferase
VLHAHELLQLAPRFTPESFPRARFDLALLSRDQTSYKADLKSAREWIVKYYDTREKSVGSALNSLRNLHESDINIEMPDLSATLDSLRNLRVTRDRPAR